MFEVKEAPNCFLCSCLLLAREEGQDSIPPARNRELSQGQVLMEKCMGSVPGFAEQSSEMHCLVKVVMQKGDGVSWPTRAGLGDMF